MEARSLSAIRGFVGPGSRLRTIGHGFTDPQAVWDRMRDGVPLVVLMVLTLLSRIPFRAGFLSTWDSVLIALAMERYNVVEARPHPPGYPVYVGLARLLDPLFVDENATLIALSILFAVGAVALLYVLARQFGSRRMALTAALLFCLAPVFLENSIKATSYTGEAFFSLAVALAAWRFHRRVTLGNALVVGALFAVAVGYRQSLVLFLLPLVAWSFLSRARDITSFVKTTSAGTISAVAVAFVWLVPMVVASGGLAAYQQTTAVQSGLVVFAHTVFNDGLAAWNDLWPRFLLYVHWELLFIIPAAVAFAFVGWTVGRRLSGDDRIRSAAGEEPEPSNKDEAPSDGDTQTPHDTPETHDSTQRSPRPSRPPSASKVALFVGIWAVPSIAFYLLVFNGWDVGPNGYILVVLPAVYLVYALVADSAMVRLRELFVPRTGSRSRKHVRGFVVVALSLLMLVPGIGLATGWPDAVEGVQEHDEWVQSWLGLKEVHHPEDTAIVTTYSWAHVKWYFPEYILWGLMNVSNEEGDGSQYLTLETHQREDHVPFYVAHSDPAAHSGHVIPDSIERVILFDFQMAGENDERRLLHDDVEVHEEWLPDGWRILYFTVQEDRPMIEDYFMLEANATDDS